MGPLANRRDFLKLLAGGAAVLSLPARTFGQQPTASEAIQAFSLHENLIQFTGAGGNVVALAGPDGVAMINGGLQDRSGDLSRAVAGHTGNRPVRILVNTDWHREHTGSNEALGRAGARIVAHEHTKQYLGAEIYVDWQDRVYEPLPSQALPNQTFYTTGAIEFGGERIEYGHLGQAHTDAAIYVFFPRANVLIAGGALSVGAYPIPDYTTGGWLGGLVAANKVLLAFANETTRIVPASGPIQTRADLQAQHDMLAAMMATFVKLMKQGMGPEDIVAAAPTREHDAQWGNPDLFVSTSYRSLWLHVRELGGIV